MGQKKPLLHVQIETGSTLLLSAGVAHLVGDRVDILAREGVFALVTNGAGHYLIHPAGRGRKRISSPGLIACLLERTGTEVGSVLPVWFPQGDDTVPFFSALLPQGYRHRSLDDDYLPLRFPEGETLAGAAYLTDSSGWSYYISSQAAAYLGEGFFLYERDSLLALRPAANGEFRVLRDASGWKHTVSARALKELLSRRFPGMKRLWLRPHGDLLVLDGEKDSAAVLPPRQGFYRVDLLHRAGGAQWARLDPDRVYLWRSCALAGMRVSVHETRDAIFLKSDSEGRFPVKRDSQLCILSRALADYISNKFSGAHFLKALSLPGGVVLYLHGSGLEAADVGQAEPIDNLFAQFHTHGAPYLYLSRNGDFLECSAALELYLGTRVEVWTAPGAVAFHPSPEGQAKLRRVNGCRRLRLNSMGLVQWLRENIGPGPRLAAQPGPLGVVCLAPRMEGEDLTRLAWIRADAQDGGVSLAPVIREVPCKRGRKEPLLPAALACAAGQRRFDGERTPRRDLTW